MALPAVIQWEPVIARDEVLLLPRPTHEAKLPARVRTLKHPLASVVATRAGVYVPGVNLEGGEIDVGDGGAVARIAPGPAGDMIAAARALASAVEPARFVVRGAPTVAVELAGGVTAREVDDWMAAVTAHDLEAACALLDDAGPDAFAAAQALVRAYPDEHRPRALLGWMHAQHGDHADARRELERACEAQAPESQRARAWSLLGESLEALGEHGAALDAYRKAVELDSDDARTNALGVACIRAGFFDEAWQALCPLGVAYGLLDPAEAMARLGRAGDARALLRVALETDPTMLDQVPEDRRPTLPELARATCGDLLALVAAARGDHG